MIIIAVYSVPIIFATKLINLHPWAIGILSLVFFLFAILAFIAFPYLSKYRYLSNLRYSTLWISRLHGMIYGWLESGWRPPVVRIVNVSIIIWIVELFFYHLETFWARPFLNATLLKALSYDEILIQGLPPESNLISWVTSGFSAVLWLYWKEIIGIWFLLEVVGFAQRASHQLVIEEVVDYTTNPDSKSSDSEKSKSNPDSKSSDEEKPKSIAVGLSDLLRTKLVRISELYRVVDEQRAIPSEPGAGRPIDATIKAEEISTLLTSAVSTDSKFALGPLIIPASSIIGLMGLILRGPRIVVSLHVKQENDMRVDDKKEGDEKKETFYLTAHMVGGEEPYSWLVDGIEPLEEDEEQKTRSIEDMVTELAHRIFATLSFEESDPLPWKAAWNFNKGLQAYRDCLHTNTRRKLFLQDAERNFTNSLREDDGFSPTYYNLGVVYTELEQMDAAEAAFSKAIEKNEKEWQAYYALALNIFERYKNHENLNGSGRDSGGFRKEFCERRDIDTSEEIREIIKTQHQEKQYQEAISLCEHVVRLLEGDASIVNKDYANLAKTYNLIGDIQGELSRHADKKTQYLCEAIKSCKIAALHSWGALLDAEARRDGVENMRDIASECLIDLAFFQSKNYKNTRDWNYTIEAEKLLKQAIYIDPTDANMYLELGRNYCSRKERMYLDQAIEMYKSALQIAPEDSKFWAPLAEAYRLMGDSCKAQDAINNIVLYGPRASSGALKKAAEVCQELDPSSTSLERNSLRLKRAALLAELDEYLLDKGCSAIISVKKKIDELEAKDEQEDFEWIFSQMALTLKRLCKKPIVGDVYEYNKLWKDKHDLKYPEEKIRKAIGKLKKKLGISGNQYGYEDDLKIQDGQYILQEIDWERLQNKLALWGLYFVANPEDENNLCKLKKNIEDGYKFIIKRKNNLEKSKAYIEEFCHFLIEQGCLYQEYRKHEEAKSCFEHAIDLLEEDLDEIKRYGLQSLLAKSTYEITKKCPHELRDESKEAALKEAQNARKLNPLNSIEHETLGEIFCDLEEFNYGLEELNQALSWHHDDPDILFKMGWTYLKRAERCSEKNRWTRELEMAAKYLEDALDLYDKDKIRQRVKARYWLGKVHLNSGAYYKSGAAFQDPI